jgi:hypothetical protein
MRLSLLLVVALSACVSVKHPPLTSGPEIDVHIVQAMKKPVERESGVQVAFSGSTRISGDWAYFDGHAFPADGSEPKDDMILDFAALLRRDSGGTWKVLEHGFSGDPYVLVHLRRAHPEAPASIFPENTSRLMKIWPADQG